jgi:hypothetical protein
MAKKPMYPEDEGGPQNVGFFAIQPFDAASSLRRFYYTYYFI